jgi:hypothetical protein
LVFGQPKICNLCQKICVFQSSMQGRHARIKEFRLFGVYLWLVVIIQKDVRRLNVTMDDLRMT